MRHVCFASIYILYFLSAELSFRFGSSNLACLDVAKRDVQPTSPSSARSTRWLLGPDQPRTRQSEKSTCAADPSFSRHVVAAEPVDLSGTERPISVCRGCVQRPVNFRSLPDLTAAYTYGASGWTYFEAVVSASLKSNPHRRLDIGRTADVSKRPENRAAVAALANAYGECCPAIPAVHLLCTCSHCCHNGCLCC